jgi:competence protein ComEC
VALTTFLLHRFAVRHLPSAALLTATARFAVLGFTIAKLRTDWVGAPVLAVPLTKAEITGRIAALKGRPGGARRLTVDVSAITGLPLELTPARIVVHQRKPAVPVGLGETVRIIADLRPPTRPGGFDFARANFFQRIGAIGFRAHPLEPATSRSPAAHPPWSTTAARPTFSF